MDEGWHLEKWRYCWRSVGFNVDRGVKITMIYALIYVQECELGREGMPSEFDGIAAVNVFKELGE